MMKLIQGLFLLCFVGMLGVVVVAGGELLALVF